jgi:hypothetical protein
METVRHHRAWLLPLVLVACVSPEAERERERVELANRLVELEQENVRLQARIEALESCLPAITGGQVIRFPTEPAIDARVLGIDPDGKRILLDKGARDGVALGFVFDVYSGTTYKGQVRVIEVEEATSFAEIEVERNPFRAGDDATTSL